MVRKSLKLTQIGSEVEQALKAIADKHGVNISTKKSATAASTVQLVIQIEDADSARQEFNLYANRLGYTPGWFNAKVQLRGLLFTVVGVLPTRSKNNLRIRRERDGKEFIASVEVVRTGLLQAGANGAALY